MGRMWRSMAGKKWMAARSWVTGKCLEERRFRKVSKATSFLTLNFAYILRGNRDPVSLLCSQTKAYRSSEYRLRSHPSNPCAHVGNLICGRLRARIRILR